MEPEGGGQEDGYYNMVDMVKSEPGVIDLVAEDLGDAQSEMQALSQFAYTVDSTVTQPTSMAESSSDTNAMPVCIWDNNGGGQVMTSLSRTENSFQMPSESGETYQLAEPPQPEHMQSISNKVQKSARLWPIINKRSVKKWQRSGGQYAGMQLKCNHCSDTFIHKRSLSRHMMIVHGPKLVWWCRRCCRFYNRRDNLRTHYRNHHPKYIKDLDYIHGVRRECVFSDSVPQSTRLVGNPVLTSGGSQVGSSIKIGQKSGTHQATQLKKKEQGVMGARQDNMQMKTTPLQRESQMRPDNNSVSLSPSGVRSQPGQLLPTEAQKSTLPLPQVRVSQIRRPSSPKAAPVLLGASSLQRNPITTTDVLAYQLQRESSRGNDIVEISEESSSDGEPESPQQSSQGPRDGNLVTVERGAPFKDLQIEMVMQGQVTKVTEEHQTFVYSGGEKRVAERRTRSYNVLYLDKVGEETEQTTQMTAPASSTLNDSQLAQRVKGKVTKVTETSSKYTYAKGEKVTKEKTKRVYDVMLLGGLTNT